jgi:hypothetical protein
MFKLGKLQGSAFIGLLILCFEAHAGKSIISVKCFGDNENAEIFVDGEIKGLCPTQVFIEAGTVEFEARKTSGEYERVFRKKLEIFPSTAEIIEIQLGKRQLTESALQARAQAKAEAERAKVQAKAAAELQDSMETLTAAKNGDLQSMKKMAGLYESGVGVAPSKAKSDFWMRKYAARHAETQLESAEAGDLQAMRYVADLYRSGHIFDRDSSLAESWTKRADILAAELALQAKRKQLESFVWFPKTKDFLEPLFVAPPNSSIALEWMASTALLPTWVPTMLLGILPSDVSDSTTKVSDYLELKRQLAFLPSKFSNPKSLLARAYQESDGNTASREMASLAN